MQSVVKVKYLESVDENTSFTDIFGNIVMDYVKKNITRTFTHAGVVPYAENFFKIMTAETTSPVRVLESALKVDGPFIPGGSIVSIPWPNFLNLDYSDMPIDEGRGLMAPRYCSYRVSRMNPFQIHHLRGEFKSLEKLAWWGTLRMEMDDSKANLSQIDYERAFAQVLTGGLHASVEMEKEKVLRVPSFTNRAPNYFDELTQNYVGEGLRSGTLFVEGNVGELCGKHATGGTIVVTGSSGNSLGDCAKNVDFYIGEELEKREGLLHAGSITQARNCNFYINGLVRGDVEAIDSNIHLVDITPDFERHSFSMMHADESRVVIREKLEKRGSKIFFFDDTVEDKYKQFVASLNA